MCLTGKILKEIEGLMTAKRNSPEGAQIILGDNEAALLRPWRGTAPRARGPDRQPHRPTQPSGVNKWIS